MKVAQKKTILLVEDEAILAMTKKMQLEKYGYVVKIVNTGEDAVETIKNIPEIDIILMDIDLGAGIDGTEAAEIVLRDHDIPIVFLSSHMEREIVEKTEKITSYGYVVKNSSITVLDASIKMAFKLFDAKKRELEKETALRKSEEKYRLISENTSDGLIHSTSDGVIDYVSPSYSSQLGYSELEVCGKDYEAISLLIHPDDRNLLFSSIYGAIEQKKKELTYTYRAKHSQGHYIWREDHARFLYDPSGSYLGAYVSCRDITDRKNIEIELQAKTKALQIQNEKLLKSQEKLRAGKIRSRHAEKVAKLGHWTLLLDSQTIIASEGADEIYGVDFKRIPVAEVQTIPLPEYRPILNKTLHDLVANDIPYDLEFKICRPCDGALVDIHSAATFDKKTNTVFGIIQDITERKQKETALLETQERLRLTLEGSELGEWDWNLKTDKITRNDQWAAMLGYTPAEIDDSFQQGFELQHPDDRDRVLQAVQDHLEGRTDSYNISYRLRTNNGTYKWIRDSGKIMERDKQGIPSRLCGTHADIDKQKQAEQLISNSKNLLTSIFESSPEIIIFALDTNFQYLAFNKKHKEAMKQIWGKEIEIGMNILDVIGDHPDRLKAKANFERALKGESFVIVEEYGDETLSRQSWLDHWSPIKTNDGEIIGLTCILLNHTERKLAEEKIKNLLAEKELVLKEVHHRIKNYMNTIRALLSMQADESKDEVTRIALCDAEKRLNSMAVLYEKLFSSKNYSKLSIAEYLPSLVDEIVSNFPTSRIVTIEKHIQDFELDTKHLQPLGLIINELLTNIMKYAFTGRPSGHITVTAAHNDGHIAISVHDNGVDFPDGASLDSHSGFGLQLVQALTEQLHGKISIEQNNGTQITLEFEK